jgi:hypothetical protein
VLSQHQGIPTIVQGIEDFGAKHATQGMNGAHETRLGWHPACALVGQGAAWYQRRQVEMGLESVIPAVQEQDATALTAQVGLAELEEGLSGGLKQEGKERAFVGEDERVEIVRQGQDAVDIRSFKPCGLSRFEPFFLAQGLARGAVAVAT